MDVRFGCVAMGSALLFIVRSRLLVYSVLLFGPDCSYILQGQV